MGRTTLRYAGRCAAAALMLAVLAALAILTVVPRAVHGAALTVLTGSMSPTIPPGAVVVVRPVDPGTLRVGDVITFQKKPGRTAPYVTHRIVAIQPGDDAESFRTQGDANRTADSEPVPAAAVRGKVMFAVPYLGTFRNAVGNGRGPVALVVASLIGYAVMQLVSGLHERTSAPVSTAPFPNVTRAVGLDAGASLSLQLLVITLPVNEFEGLQPHQVAALLRMDVLDEGPDLFTVAVAREPMQLDALTEALLPFNPVSVIRSEVLSVPVCAPIPGLPFSGQPHPDCHVAA